MVKWRQIVFPNGGELNLPELTGTDAAGYSGFQDQVNHHYAKVWAPALLMSAISAGMMMSQYPLTSSGPYGNGSYSISPGQMAAMGAGQQLGQQAIGHMASVQIAPTIEIRPGYHFRVLVTRDLVFSGPYADSASAGRSAVKGRCWMLRLAGAAIGSATLVGVCLIGAWLPAELGYCLNITPSEPVGIYREIGGWSGTRGFGVAEAACDSAVFHANRYLPANIPLIKRVAAIAGDVVETSAYGVRVNRILWPDSAPLTHDQEGRSLQPYPIRNLSSARWGSSG